MKYILFFFTVLSIFSCKPKDELRVGKLKNLSADKLRTRIAENSYDGQYLNAKAKIKYADDNRSVTAFSDIRIHRDEAIWMNAKVFGIEGARIMVRPDSVFVINRVNKEYLARDFGYLRREYGLPFDFEGLQALLLGNPVFFTPELAVQKDSTSYTLTGENERFVNTYRADGATFKITEMIVREVKENRTARSSMADFKHVGENQTPQSLLAHYRDIEIEDPELGSIRVRIEINDTEVDGPYSMPFKVSSKYVRK